jgi:hypothetical protein
VVFVAAYWGRVKLVKVYAFFVGKPLGPGSLGVLPPSKKDMRERPCGKGAFSLLIFVVGHLLSSGIRIYLDSSEWHDFSVSVRGCVVCVGCGVLWGGWVRAQCVTIFLG